MGRFDWETNLKPSIFRIQKVLEPSHANSSAENENIDSLSLLPLTNACYLPSPSSSFQKETLVMEPGDGICVIMPPWAHKGWLLSAYSPPATSLPGDPGGEPSEAGPSLSRLQRALPYRGVAKFVVPIAVCTWLSPSSWEIYWSILCPALIEVIALGGQWFGVHLSLCGRVKMGLSS